MNFFGGIASTVPSIAILLWVFNNRTAPIIQKSRAWAVAGACSAFLFIAAMLQMLFMLISGMVSGDILNNVMGGSKDGSSSASIIFENIVIVGITEEFTKFMAVFVCTRGMKSSEISGEYVNFALVSASTFVIIENLMYSVSQDFSGSLLRALYSGPLHCVVTLFAVLTFLKAREKKNPLIFIGGMSVSILIHGLSNSVLFITAGMENGETLGFLYILFSTVFLDITLVNILISFRRDVRLAMLEKSGFDENHIPLPRI